ncbi:serine/threonine protein kinase [Pseudenhygromyxa sp. WMMC2535]|uniref:serine/threonine-protein kinase n=1 Tax=Pseudenhygromyxa sp. WMMC2535 TaxID=2712867 RepID=UPI001553F92D|nr:serine/threonine-protein kinase [Pseudenhygromyxa sp. WMMC2535]NVB40681.1 serine/threonine protein kinase [Pseudenhygromyxa sp. WMMC2535]
MTYDHTVGERGQVSSQTLLERYTLQEPLGEGGMGVVYRAIDEHGQTVAIKRLHADVASSPELALRFEREARAQSMLAHPNIAALHAVGLTPEGGMFFVMEYVEGHDLADELDQRGALAATRAVDLACQLLSALHHAHQLGIVHRDLKPENILLARDADGREQLKIIDFGLVKMLNDVLGKQECMRLTTKGMIFGTPEYMAPEQILGEEVDPRTDLYAVGILLCEMLTGRRPFEAEEVNLLWRAHLNDPVPALAELAPSLGAQPDLDAILRLLLAKRPEERFANAHAARRALASAELGLGTPG